MLAIDLSEQVESVFDNTLIRGRLAELGGVDASGEAFANAWDFDCFWGANFNQLLLWDFDQRQQMHEPFWCPSACCDLRLPSVEVLQ